jgi:hypothetical protein
MNFLPTNDVADLCWHFGIGQTYFERSTFGMQMERQARFHYTSEPCPDCAVARPGRPMRRPGFDADDCPCERCDGRGVTVRQAAGHSRGSVTAQPMQRERTAVVMEVPDDVLFRYARLSRGVSRLSHRSAVVLEEAFGDVGSYFAAELGDRTLAVAMLTPAGIRLLRESQHDGAHEHVAFTRVIRHNRIQPSGPTTALISEAMSQAKELVKDACKEWTSVADRPRGVAATRAFERSAA